MIRQSRPLHSTSDSSDDTEAVFRLVVQLPAPDDHVTLCHCPPGNPDNCRTITVGGKASDARMANHGNDYFGACAGGGGAGDELIDDGDVSGNDDRDSPIDLKISWGNNSGSTPTGTREADLSRRPGRSAGDRSRSQPTRGLIVIEAEEDGQEQIVVDATALRVSLSQARDFAPRDREPSGRSG